MGANLSTKQRFESLDRQTPVNPHHYSRDRTPFRDIPQCDGYIPFAQHRHVFEFATTFNYYLPDDSIQYSDTFESSHVHYNSPVTSEETRQSNHGVFSRVTIGDSYSEAYKVETMVRTPENDRTNSGVSMRRRKERAVESFLRILSVCDISAIRKPSSIFRSNSVPRYISGSFSGMQRTSTKVTSFPNTQGSPDSTTTSSTLPQTWFPYKID